MVHNEKNEDPFFLYKMCWNKPKNISRYFSFKHPIQESSSSRPMYVLCPCILFINQVLFMIYIEIL